MDYSIWHYIIKTANCQVSSKAGQAEGGKLGNLGSLSRLSHLFEE